MGRRKKDDTIDLDAVKSSAVKWNADFGDQRKPTINDIADLAGVSKKTVSRVINDSERVQDDMRTAIKEIIRIVGYRPDPQARGLANRRSSLVGLIFDNPNPQYVVNIQLGILNGLRGTGSELVVHPCNRSSETFLEDARRFVEDQKLFGVILTPSVSEDERLAEILREIGCPYIRIASVALDRNERMIVTNDRIGGAKAARHLVDSGHTRVAFLSGSASFRSSFERRAGFEEELEARGLKLPEEYVLQGDYTFESGLANGAKFLDMNPRPTAVFAANDEMAAGVLQALRVAGQDAPQSMSVIGFDDFEVATRVWPRLTTVRSPTLEIGNKAAKRLIDLDKGRLESADSYQTVPELIVRESTRILAKTEG